MKQTLETTVNTEETYSTVRTSLLTVGTVKKDSPSGLILKGTTNYGMQTVNVSIEITAKTKGCSIHIETKGDDIWGVGAKKGMERLAELIEINLEAIKFETDTNLLNNNVNQNSNNNSESNSFDVKTFRFDTDVNVYVTTEGIKATANNGSTNIEAKNLDNFSYIDYVEPKLSPIGMATRVLVFGWLGAFALTFFVKDEWAVLFFEANPKDLFFGWLAIVIFILSFLLAGFIWTSFVMDMFLETGLYDQIIVRYFAHKGYQVTLGNRSGNNIVFFAMDYELSKIRILEKKMQELKSYFELNKSQTTQPQVNATNLDELKKLGELYQNGILTKDEFDKKKVELLSR